MRLSILPKLPSNLTSNAQMNNSKKTFEIIISHFDESLYFVPAYLKNYSKILCTKVPEAAAGYKDYFTSVFTVPNVAREVPCYLQYIIMNYDDLPEVILFLHGHGESYHMDFHVKELPLVNFSKINYANGYININRFANLFYNGNWRFEAIQKYWQELFEEYLGPLQPRFRSKCCAQFFIHKSRILKHPLEAYQKWYNFCLSNREQDFKSSRIFEWVWPIIFGAGFDENIPQGTIINGKKTNLTDKIVFNWLDHDYCLNEYDMKDLY